MKDKIQSLQALRAIAIIGIILSHCGITFNLGSWGTSIFFVLSGFLMAYNYKDRIDSKSLSIGYCVKFGIKRIMKIYPLHIIVTILSIPNEFILANMSGTKVNLVDLVVKFFMHVFLIQSWIPDDNYYYSLNSLDWYLSVSLFLYMLFPVLLIFIRKDSNSKRLIKAAVAYGLMLAFNFISCWIFAGFDSLLSYFTYVFPLLRVGDFFAGAALGLCFSESRKEYPAQRMSLIELLTALVAVLLILYNNVVPHDTWFLAAMSHSPVLYLPSSLALVYIFAMNKGILTGILSNKVMVFIGNNSSYYYLIHQKLYIYVYLLSFYISVKLNNYVAFLLVIIIMSLLVWGYKVIEERLFKKRT